MTTNVNDINKIYCNEPISVRHINMTSLLFIDGKVIPKAKYSVVDNYINILEPAENKISLYQHKDSSYYYEYHINLTHGNTIISGNDIYGNTLKNITATNSMIFVEGYKLLPSEYVNSGDGKSIEILTPFAKLTAGKVIIYTSESLQYLGKVTDIETWNNEKHSFVLDDYTYLRYLFFKNGELLTRDLFYKVGDKVTLNIKIREGVDIIEYYRLPIDTENVVFDGQPGYFSYGPRDNLNLLVPDIYDAEVTFQSIVRLAIDDVRKGFFIREVNGDGCLMITGNDFETNIAYCTTVVKFSKDNYDKEEYFVQVPNARSILKYISEYDLNKMLMPEILGSFQRLLLDETYDSIQRLKNVRSINRISSSQITNLIKFMGLNIDVSNLTLAKKHALLEELTNFYNIVGTRESYNFYNTMTASNKIIELEQLFTPIKDYYDPQTSDTAKRYVDFRTAEELGAITHKRYEFPFEDLGEVAQLANPTDSFTNQPRSEGTLTNPDLPHIASTSRPITYMNDDGEIVTSIQTGATLNNYIITAYPGPNAVSEGYDFGSVAENAEDFYDFGLVSETIKGHWVEWTDWDRPKNWYPTNHINVAVQIPADIDYATFMTEFKNTFYDIASAVLYIHSIIEVYVFGKENPWDTDDEGSDGGANFGIVTSSLYYSIEWSFTNDPEQGYYY